MKHRSFLAILLVGVLVTAGSAMAGNGRWNNNWNNNNYCGPGYYRGGGGYYNNGPRWGWGGGPGWGWGGGGGFGITVVTAPRPVYRTVYVQQQNYGSSALAAAQQRLARLGYYRGYIDGVFGPQTSNAVANYQANNGLRVNGRLDGSTMASLGL